MINDGWPMDKLNSLKKIHKRILIVDDDEAILDVLGQYMKIIGLMLSALPAVKKHCHCSRKIILTLLYQISKWPTWMD